MKQINFTKMHGAGNDYIYINTFTQHINNPSELAVKLSQRRFGIGSDGLILIGPSEKADVEMIMYNADGSKSEMCGNGLRCVAKYTVDHILKDIPERITVESNEKIYEVTVDKKKSLYTINMGEPIFETRKIPSTIQEKTIINHSIELEGETFEITCVNMGNPHAVIYVKDLENFNVAKYGKALETHPSFPERTNVEFVQIISKKELKQRTWERGAGETWACGSGASAVCAAGLITKKTSSPLLVHLVGGDLTVSWAEGEPLYLSGPAEEVFEGKFNI